MYFEVANPPYSVSTDPGKIDIELVAGFLAESYWARGIPRAIVERAIEGSLCFGVYDASSQVGFARVITDSATYAYLSDVFVLESHRGLGLAKFLMQVITDHPALQGIRRFSLTTRDAHDLYNQFGFRPVAHPERYMEIARPDIYVQATDATTRR